MAKDMPLVSMIEKYIAENNTIFHMPGHKGGKAFSGFGEMSFLREAGMYDLTEVPGTDNLIFPEADIKEALIKCSIAFGSDSSFFVVNGSTCGIHALIGAACKPGDRLIVSRDCHRSVINALMVFNVEPVYIYPNNVEEFGITGVVTPDNVEEALKNNPDCIGVFLTRPTYYGLCCDIKGVSEIVHKYNKILLVDEAHGAHLRFGGDFYPQSSINYADACVQSAHKTLAALNQGAYLHLKGDKIKKSRVSKMLFVLQTSSPSYLIMASLDFSRYVMEKYGHDMLKELFFQIETFKKLLSENTGFKILDKNIAKNIGHCDHCPDRLVIRVSDAGYSGYDAEKYLRSQHNIQVEMSDAYNIVCLCTVFNEKRDLDNLLEALKELWKNRKNAGPDVCKDFSRDKKLLLKNRRKIPANDLLFKDIQYIPLEKSQGRIAGEPIVIYPPGIPFIIPGEYIDGDDIDYLKKLILEGAEINGIVYDRNDDEAISIPCFLEEV